MNNNDNKVSKGRKPRSTYSDLEKKMFINIMKTGEGGQFWNQIVESKGKSTNVARHDLWQNVAKIFSEATGRDFDCKQVKSSLVIVYFYSSSTENDAIADQIMLVNFELNLIFFQV